jgi:cobalt-zinc-cadmium efflux system protein
MHQHTHHATNYNRAFAIGVALNSIYIFVEAGFGFGYNSLALLADAAHNLSDVAGLLMAWAGYYLSRLKPTSKYTYGWRSSSIVAAFVNSVLLLVVVGGLTWEAVERLSSPVDVPGNIIMVVAGIGVLINGLTALLFFKGCQGDINLRGAFMHMTADAAVSLGVVLGGWLTMTFTYAWIDPFLTLVVAVVILLGTWQLFNESSSMMLQAVPAGIDAEGVERFLLEQPEVEGMHDLHIWAMSTTETALTCHLIVPNLEHADEFLKRVCSELHRSFGIEHSTLQIERSADLACPLASADKV